MILAIMLMAFSLPAPKDLNNIFFNVMTMSVTGKDN
jgi:hypothetical protein